MSSTALLSSWRMSTVEIWSGPRRENCSRLATSSPMRLVSCAMISRALRLGSSAGVRARTDSMRKRHRRQGIVQFVGDAGGQLAHAGQLGGMPELLGHGPDLFVGSFLLGDVAADRGGADDWPAPSLIGETVRETSMRWPSFRMCTVS